MLSISKLWNERNYQTIISIFGLAIIFLHLPKWSMFTQHEIFYFLALCIIASNSSIEFKSGIKMTMTSPVCIFVLLILNINMAVLMGSIGVLSYHIFTRRRLEKCIFNIAQFTISIFLAGTFLYRFYDRNLNLPGDFLYIIPAIIIFEVTNLLLVSRAISFKMNESFKQTLIDGLKESQVGLPLYLSNGLIMYICYQAYGLWGLALIIIPLFSVTWLFKASKRADEHEENAYICPTTRLKNRRCLNDWLEREFPNTVQNDPNISFILIDIDDFKRINDQFGHDVGDQVLGEFGDLIRNNIRDTDLIYRYGGEEFVIILPAYNKAGANVIIERLRETVTDYTFSNGKLNITFSAGIATLDSSLLNDDNMNTGNELIRRADMAMYSAKQSGKNQTQFFRH